jgi:hypothetical protein
MPTKNPEQGLADELQLTKVQAPRDFEYRVLGAMASHFFGGEELTEIDALERPLHGNVSTGLTPESVRFATELAGWAHRFEDTTSLLLSSLLRVPDDDDSEMELDIPLPQMGHSTGTRRLRIVARSVKQPSLDPGEEESY